MASHDSSWDIFRNELKRWMELRRFTNKALAEAINTDPAAAGLNLPVDEQIIKRWRHSTSPPLAALKVIGRILAMSEDPTGRAPYDSTYLPRAMGILDSAPENRDLIEAAYRLQSIRAKITEAQNGLAAITADEGVVNIVRAATASHLASAVMPVFEGPRGYPMHVSDRIDLRSSRLGDPAPDPRDHPMVADALRSAFAVVSRRRPRFCGDDPDLSAGGTMTNWAVQHIGRPRTANVHSSHPGLPAVAITSVTTTAWPDDIGDLLALVLGYGFTSTRDLARELINDPYNSPSLRGEIHDNFLAAATPSRRVWSHHSVMLADAHRHAPFADAEGRTTRDLVQVFLVEDDATLEHNILHARGANAARTPEEINAELRRFQETRDAVVTRAETRRDDQRLLLVPVTFHSAHEERWEQVLHVTLQILRHLDAIGIQPELTDLHDRLARARPNVVPQLLRWLADHDAPFVERTHRTTR